MIIKNKDGIECDISDEMIATLYEQHGLDMKELVADSFGTEWRFNFKGTADRHTLYITTNNKRDGEKIRLRSGPTYEREQQQIRDLAKAESNRERVLIHQLYEANERIRELEKQVLKH
jgi:hypothetical protein